MRPTKIATCLVVVLSVFLLATVSNADPILYLTPDGPSGTPQAFSDTVTLNDTVELNLYYKFLESEYPSAEYEGFFSVDAEIDFSVAGIVTPQADPVTWGADIDDSFSLVNVPSNVDTSRAMRIRGYALDEGVYGDILIATISFDATGIGSTTLSMFDPYPSEDAEFFPWSVSKDALDADVQFVGGTLNVEAVPISGTVWLLGSGLFGLIGFRRS